ncbi:MAG: WD40/YVTN/BNR-like repeat-containing protein, partial [Flavobacteriales bacterium]
MLTSRPYFRSLFVFFFFQLGFSFLHSSIAQPWMRPSMVAEKTEVPGDFNLKAIQARFNQYWKGRSIDAEEGGNREEGSYQQFRRWEWFMLPRTFPTGTGFDPEIIFKESRRYKMSRQLRRSTIITANWQVIGPSAIPSSGGGSGRVNVVRVSPVNNSVLYIGTAAGGVWKSVNYGQTWTALSDGLPSISIADIAINPRYPDSIYIATGDGYGYETGGGFWGGTYSAGVCHATEDRLQPA